MRICLIGGIFGARRRGSEYLKVTPETTLEAGFRAAGHDVTTLSHYDSVDFDRFDVVHVHHMSYGAVRLASDPARTPFVFTAHDASPMSGARVSLQVKLAMRYVLSRADAVVGLTNSYLDFVRRHYDVADARLATIPNGIDANQFRFRRRNPAGRGGPWRLLFCGQLIPLKGVDLILRALAELPALATLTLVYQTAQLEGELRELARSLGIAGRVRFAGRLDPTALAGLYQASDLLILPSETEALPSVITEAMLSGLPFIATNVGGIPEQAAGFGRLLEQRTVAGLAAAIAEVTGRYHEFASRAFDMSTYARHTFTIQAMVEQHLHLYSAVAGLAPRRHRGWTAAANHAVRAAVERWGRQKTPAPTAA